MRENFEPPEDNYNNNTIDLDKYIFKTSMKMQYKLQIPSQRQGNDGLGNLEGIFKHVKNGVNTIMFGNLALNILFSSSLQMLWGTINTL